jgi:hypothetical protein
MHARNCPYAYHHDFDAIDRSAAKYQGWQAIDRFDCLLFTRSSSTVASIEINDPTLITE